MTRSECRSELVVRERTGELSNVERTALDAHLATCAPCRLTQRLGRDFEADARLEAGDGERIAALSKIARAWAADARERVSAVHERPARRRAPIWVFAAAAAFVALGASAAIRAFSPVATSPQVTEPARIQPPEPKREAPPARPEASPPAEAVTPTTPAAPRAAAPEETPRALFQRANEARRLGEGTRAASLYRKLIARFPASPEAALSQVRLGGMLLEQGDGRTALGHFDRYLAEQPGGALSPEALYGRGRALASLGRSAEESRAWTRLLADFPKSPYAGHARRRLETLGTGR
jgi:TolA-binding protein